MGYAAVLTVGVKTHMMKMKEGGLRRLRKVLFLTDTHSPFPLKEAYNLIEKVVREVLFDEVVVGGDFPDFYSISAHSKNPSRAGKFEEEVAVTNTLLRQVESWGSPRSIT